MRKFLGVVQDANKRRLGSSKEKNDRRERSFVASRVTNRLSQLFEINFFYLDEETTQYKTR